MKSKAVVIMAAIAAVAGLGIGVHRAVRTEVRHPAEASGQENRGREHVPAAGHGLPTAEGVVGRDAPRRVSLGATDIRSNKLAIPPEYLASAGQQAEEMAASMAGNLATMQDGSYHGKSMNMGDPSRKIALRLEVDEQVAAKLDEILTQDRAQVIQERIAEEKAGIERTGQLLEHEREDYVNYLALKSMLARGKALSEEQEAFYRDFRQRSEPENGSVPAKEDQWYEKSEVLEAMERCLSEEQQSSLATFVEEQKNREQEMRTMHAYMRAGRIAERLGLNEADRAVLSDYLQESPDASSAELSELLTPELRKLLPAGM